MEAWIIAAALVVAGWLVGAAIVLMRRASRQVTDQTGRAHPDEDADSGSER